MSEAQAIAQFMNSRMDALSAATRAGVRRSSKELAKEANRQLKANFSNRAGRAKARFFAAKGTLPDAAIVSIRPGFLRIFEEGATIKGDRYLVIPIPPFKRVGGQGWGAAYRQLKRRYKIAILPLNDGYLITADKRPAYKLQKAVDIPQKTTILKSAEKIGNRTPDYIDELLNL